jgi:membrane protease YdiL (CAAX protease family)
MKFFSMVIVVVESSIDSEFITTGNINTEFAGMGFIDILFLVISSAVVAPIIEEIIFRGILLNALSCVMGVKGAVLVSSVVFSLLHRTSVATVVTATVVKAIFALHLWRRNKSALSECEW